jgi:ABC-type sugar transport system permease subunit
MILNRDIRGDRFFKMGIFVPQVLSLPVIALIWSYGVYSPRRGVLVSLLNMGITDPPAMLAEKHLVIWAIILAAAWRQVGYIMILYVAGLKNVDPTLLDASTVDGANGWQRFRHVIFPLLAPVTTIVVVISIIDSLRSFDMVWVMTRGGPANASSVLAVLMYIQAFNNYKMGLGAATAVVLFSISLVFIIAYLSRVMKDELEF